MQTAVNPRRWTALAVIALAQFIVIMDTSIIGVALPDIRADLGFSPGDLSWVFNAYVVAFGGLLLLGGRLSDLFGAKRIFALGWTVLTAGSLAAGLAETAGVEIAARAVQGAGAALIAPSALTLLMMLFGHDPRELMKAFAVYGAAAPAGGTAGVFLGGVITEWASWPWVFYINIPVALLALALTPRLMPSAARAPRLGRHPRRHPGHRRPGGHCVRHRARARAGLGLDRDAARARRRPGRAGRVRGRAERPPRAADAAEHLPHAEPRCGQPRAGPARRRLGADVVLPEPLPPASARLRRIRGRLSAAADDPRHHAAAWSSSPRD